MSVIENREKIRELFETTSMTQEDIALAVGVTRAVVEKEIQRSYPADVRGCRKVACYQRSKVGPKNPMYGKRGDEHHSYKGEISDGYGYLMILKPAWYTGRKKSKHVFVHTLVMCEALGLTELPAGWSIHHIDGRKTNNGLYNLALLTNSAHMRLHQLERATTIPQGSREYVTPEAQSDRCATEG